MLRYPSSALRLWLDSRFTPVTFSRRRKPVQDSLEDFIMNNTINLLGNVGNDPKVTTFESGSKVARFSLAIKEYAADGTAKTMWIDIEAWGKTADRVLEVVKKGREVAVTGRLAINSYDKQIGGQTIKMTRPVVKLLGFHACGRKLQAIEDDGADKDSKKHFAA
jgi:single-strand DNA-binding protein